MNKHYYYAKLVLLSGKLTEIYSEWINGDEQTINIMLDTAGKAIDILPIARNCGLKVSYHPHGGMTEKLDQPVFHTVHVHGSRKLALDFKKELAKNDIRIFTPNDIRIFTAPETCV